MWLLEIVCGVQIVLVVLEVVLVLGEWMGKVSVVVGNCYGFIGNCMFEFYVIEVCLMLLEGVLLYQVDWVFQVFGFVMGLFCMYDVVGIDLEWCVCELVGVGQDQLVVQVDNCFCEMGCFGQKSGVGYYCYVLGSCQVEYDIEVDVLVFWVVEMLGYLWCDFVDEEIFECCLLVLVNEGVKIFDEGIVVCSVDIDIVYLNGYGFFVVEGGFMVWVDCFGVVELL